MNTESDKHILAGRCRQMSLLLLLVLISFVVRADFSLQFNAYLAEPVFTPSACDGSCTVEGGDHKIGGLQDWGGLTNGNDSWNDGSRFIQEKLVIDGASYFHVVVGSPDSNFALETYVSIGSSYANNINNSGNTVRAFSSSVGGNERALIGNKDVLSLSGGNMSHSLAVFGNAKDPFGDSVAAASSGEFKSYDLTGNGTADPRRVALRMLVSDADVAVEVLKPMLGRKPLIVQTTTDAEEKMVGLFSVDMRGLSYTDTVRAAPLVNRLSLNSATLPSKGVADFDMSKAQRSYVTAGRYSYQPGQGWQTRVSNGAGGYDYTSSTTGWDTDNSVYDEGSYTYVNGTAGFNLEGVKWGSFFDAEQNAVYCNSQTNRKLTVCPP